MSRFSELYVKCGKSVAEEIIKYSQSDVAAGLHDGNWIIALDAMRRSASVAIDPFVYWYYLDGEQRTPYALVAMSYSSGEYSLEDGKLWVANVVPATKDQLMPAEYNSIVEKFKDEILTPIVLTKWPNLKITLTTPSQQQGDATPRCDAGGSCLDYFDFIIGLDSQGFRIRYSCDPGLLSNYFEAKPNAPHYLTPVYFEKAVLDKYQNQPTKYDVEPGLLRCKGDAGVEWCLPIDNMGDEIVSVWLGDLGRELPYVEQLHFASHNVIKGRMSYSFFTNQMDGEFSASENPVHVFNAEYHKLYDVFADRLGWPLLLPLEKSERYYLSSLKLLTVNEQKEFDEQILALAKILPDSLNVDALRKLNVPDQTKGGINILEHIVGACGASGYEPHINFLRNLQNLRSASSAHRKGENYIAIAHKLGLEPNTRSQVLSRFIKDATSFCQYMETNVGLFSSGSSALSKG